MKTGDGYFVYHIKTSNQNEIERRNVNITISITYTKYIIICMEFNRKIRQLTQFKYYSPNVLKLEITFCLPSTTALPPKTDLFRHFN